MRNIQIKYESGIQKILNINELLSIQAKTEEKFTIEGSRNKEIYFYGIYVPENTLCLMNYQILDIFINGTNYNRQVPLSLYKDVNQVAKNFFFINSCTNLQNCQNLMAELLRTKDLNSKCDNSIKETFTLIYDLS